MLRWWVCRLEDTKKRVRKEEKKKAAPLTGKARRELAVRPLDYLHVLAVLSLCWFTARQVVVQCSPGFIGSCRGQLWTVM
jgi:hypothetical protein